MNTLIGQFSACIGLDSRYTDTLEVFYNEDKTVTVSIRSSAPSGGMDSFTNSHVMHTFKETVPAKAADVMKTIRRAINSRHGTILKRYGKPRKKFWWQGQKGLDFGLSLARAQAALDRQTNVA